MDREISSNFQNLGICGHCHRNMEIGSLNQKYCSRSCKERARAKRQRIHRVVGPLGNRNCIACGKEFHPKCEAHLKCKSTCEKKAPLLAKECAVCGSGFVGYGHKKYCSFRCSRKFQGRKKKVVRKSKFGCENNKPPKKPCECCGYPDLRAIHRHHINPHIGNSGGYMSLCANCHVVFHSIVGHSKAISENMSKEAVLAVLYKSAHIPLENF